MPSLELSRSAARAMLIAAQGLLDPISTEPDADEVLNCIRRMGVLQIDTIHVVARSPYLVLWSRLGQYDPTLLEDLLAHKRIFEYWSHEACFIPIERFPIYRSFMLDPQRRLGLFRWFEMNREMAERMLEVVAEKKEVKSSDFERKDGQSGNWWNWKDEKVALECLHTAGRLMIARRERFQRVYTLPELILPDWQDSQAPAIKDAIESLVEESVRCLGAPPAKFIADYMRLPKKEVTVALDHLAEAGKILPISIEDMRGPAFVHRDHLDKAMLVQEGRIVPSRTVLLSPFDPIVWDRSRSRNLFDFDYTIECYVSAPKRKYGYFVLPILHRDRLVGRLDAKAHRAEKIFEIKCLFFEPGIQPDEEMLAAIAGTIQDCAKWHKTPKVKVTKTEPRGFARQIQALANKKV